MLLSIIALILVELSSNDRLRYPNKVIVATKLTYNIEAKIKIELNLEMLKVHALAGVGSIPTSSRYAIHV